MLSPLLLCPLISAPNWDACVYMYIYIYINKIYTHVIPIHNTKHIRNNADANICRCDYGCQFAYKARGRRKRRQDAVTEEQRSNSFLTMSALLTDCTSYGDRTVLLTCLMRPHSFCAHLVVARIIVRCYTIRHARINHVPEK